VLLALALGQTAPAAAQVIRPPDMRLPSEGPETARARERMKDGERLLRDERFEEAADAFVQAIAFDRRLVMAHYGLGTARMAQRDYPAAATAFEAAKRAFRERSAAEREVAQRLEAKRQARIQVLRQRLGQTAEQGAAGGRRGARGAQRQEDEAELAMLEAAGHAPRGESPPPAGLSLSLGSAYFRAGRIEAAEREYRAALAADPQVGEARINLAVVLLVTGRPQDARSQLEYAKKAGARVPPGLEKDVDSALTASR
jgi:tetratricopeptide (TPR) repeat protein